MTTKPERVPSGIQESGNPSVGKDFSGLISDLKVTHRPKKGPIEGAPAEPDETVAAVEGVRNAISKTSQKPASKEPQEFSAKTVINPDLETSINTVVFKLARFLSENRTETGKIRTSLEKAKRVVDGLMPKLKGSLSQYHFSRPQAEIEKILEDILVEKITRALDKTTETAMQISFSDSIRPAVIESLRETIESLNKSLAEYKKLPRTIEEAVALLLTKDLEIPELADDDD